MLSNLRTYLREFAILYTTACNQSVLAEIVLKQKSSFPNAAGEPVGFDIQKVVLSVDSDITGINVIPSIRSHEFPASCWIENIDSATRHLGTTDSDLRSVTKRQRGSPLTTVRPRSLGGKRNTRGCSVFRDERINGSMESNSCQTAIEQPDSRPKKPDCVKHSVHVFVLSLQRSNGVRMFAFAVKFNSQIFLGGRAVKSAPFPRQ